MPFLAKDIDIFILTYNRPKMCEQALKSVLKQSAKGGAVYVLDNSDNRKTEELLKKYPSVNYIATDPSKRLANIIKMQQLISAPYALTLHDDDLLHPGYIELALKALNQYKDISLIAAKHTDFSNTLPAAYKNPLPLKECFYLIEGQEAFAFSFWKQPMPSWTGSIVKAEAYKKLDIHSLANAYHKLADCAFMIEVMKSGLAIIFADPSCVFYRHHKGQDTQNKANHIHPENILNMAALFKNFADKAPSKLLKNIYFLNVCDNLKNYWNTFGPSVKDKQTILDGLFEELKKQGIITDAMIKYSQRNKNIFYRILSFWPKLIRPTGFYNISMLKQRHF